MEYTSFSWEETENAVQSLSSQISETGFRPDILVGISRGGLVPARLFSDTLNVPLLYTIRISFYSSVGKRKEKPEITQPLPVDIAGKKIILIDDISDSGKSLALADEHAKSLNSSTIKSATLHYKPTSIFKPDFFHAETTAWVVYPWEIEEFHRETGKRVEEI